MGLVDLAQVVVVVVAEALVLRDHAHSVEPALGDERPDAVVVEHAVVVECLGGLADHLEDGGADLGVDVRTRGGCEVGVPRLAHAGDDRVDGAPEVRGGAVHTGVDCLLDARGEAVDVGVRQLADGRVRLLVGQVLQVHDGLLDAHDRLLGQEGLDVVDDSVEDHFVPGGAGSGERMIACAILQHAKITNQFFSQKYIRLKHN